MRRLERYVQAGGKSLRLGYTTGTCAAAAARAATELLLADVPVPAVRIETPAGIEVVVEVEEAERGPSWARCAVRKDAGDDPDVTDGVLVWARVSLADASGVFVEGGEGVGRVTKPGLDQPVGAAAINSVPRAMIERAAREAAEAHGYAGGLVVEVSIPEGVALARQTFNPRLGIEGGISVLGTTGIVRPMSEDALVASIALELRVLRATGAVHVLVVPGNYGAAFAADALGLSQEHMVSCSNYVGEAIDTAGALGFESMLLVGHLGKLVKVAGGVMNTHSRVADCRMEVLAALAACAGAPAELVRSVLDATTTDAALDVLASGGEDLLGATLAGLALRMENYLARRAAGRVRVEAVVFSQVRGLLCQTSGAAALLAHHRSLAGLSLGIDPGR